jgi:hypothetical protein
MRASVVYSRFLFLFAGLMGLVFITPMYWLEAYFNRNAPPAIAHPEYYYGFVGVALACQVLFLVIAIDPVRYWLAIIPAILEKGTYGVAMMVLWSEGRVSGGPVFSGVVDSILGVLFVVSFLALWREKWVR